MPVARIAKLCRRREAVGPTRIRVNYGRSVVRPCFMFSNVAAKDKSPAHLSIFEEIGMGGLQAKQFNDQMRAIKASGQTHLSVEISSPGGSVVDALAMYNALRASGMSITTKVMGAAMSAASLVFMAGDKRQMPRNTFLMLHNPSTIVYGNEDDMREAADMLRKIGALVRGTYRARSNLSDERTAEILAKDSYFSADEAKDLGLATEVLPDAKATARFDLAKAQLPAHVMAAYGVAALGAPVVQSGSDLWKAFRAARNPAQTAGPVVQSGSDLWKTFRESRRHAG